MDRQKREDAHEVIDSTGKTQIKLDIFLRGLVQKLMGVALDNGRMAINTDKQSAQFEKSTKDKFYEISDNAIKYLTVRGVIQNDDKSKDGRSQ